MHKLKIYKGTRTMEAPRLCDTCTYGLVARGPLESEETVFCRLSERPVHIRVVECTSYYDRTATSLVEFEKIAWVLHVDSKRQKIGFLTSAEWKKRHDEELIPSFAE